MSELLAALEADPTRKRRARLGAAFGVITAGFLFSAWLQHRAATRSECRAEGNAIFETWNGPSRERIRAAFLNDASPNAAARAERIIQALDAYAGEWQATQTESAQATRIERTQSEEVHERRSDCLLQNRMRLEVIVELLATDGAARRNALRLLDALGPPVLCSNAATAERRLPPKDPSSRARVHEAERDNARSVVLKENGSFREARALAREARSVAYAGGDAAVEADAVLHEAMALERSFEDNELTVKTALEAFKLAEAAGIDSVATDAAGLAAHVLAGRLGRLDAALAWIEVARAKMTRLGADTGLRARLLGRESIVLAMDRRTVSKAVDLNAEMIELHERLYSGHQILCADYSNRAYFLSLAGKLDSALATARQSVACNHQSGFTPHGLVDTEYTEVALFAGRLQEALDACDVAVKHIDPKTPSPSCRGRSRFRAHHPRALG